MRRVVSVNRLAKSAGLDPETVVLALIDRGVEIDDPNRSVEGDARKAVRAVIKEPLAKLKRDLCPGRGAVSMAYSPSNY